MLLKQRFLPLGFLCQYFQREAPFNGYVSMRAHGSVCMHVDDMLH